MTPEEAVSDAVRAGQIKAELQKLARKYNLRFEGLMPEEIHGGAMNLIAPQYMNTVRTFPSELHSAGIEHLLFSLDRTVMEGESGGYCADWHARQSRKYVADIVRETSVNTPNDIVAWLDRRDRPPDCISLSSPQEVSGHPVPPGATMGWMPVFLLGAGFNVDANDEIGPVFGQSLHVGRYQIDCGYPLVGEMAHLCFDLTEIPGGKSIEELFSLALERHDYVPLTRLADRLREADYRIAFRLASTDRTNCYQRFFDTFPTCNFLTFNYDSFPETFLFRRKRWYPPDGYGVAVTAHLPPLSDEFSVKPSTSIVLHLHGSLSIRTSEYRPQRSKGSSIAWLTEREPAAYLFDPASISANFAPYHRVAGADDIEDRIIAPVPDKSAGLTQAFVCETYRKALELLRDSTGTIVSIGYSFNGHDGASYEPVLRTLGETRDRRLILVSPDAVQVAKMLREQFPAITIVPVALTFKAWVLASFSGIGQDENGQV